MPHSPIAIIGIGCRFPQARNPHEFWELLRQGKDAIAMATEVDSFRQQIASGQLTGIDRFDADFFNIAPEVAELMDPQQRLLLEVAWESFEDAGLIPETLAGSQTGVFVGLGSSGYGSLLNENQRQKFEVTTGNQPYIAANRLSYFFDFQGVSMTLNTACSSALMAVDRACQSLWLGESELALAGGVNLILDEEGTTRLKKGGLIAADGRCKVFDAAADGYSRSEGIGLVVLKPLTQAEKDGDRIYAVIKGSAVNHNGRNNGLTAPNFQAQIQLLEKAYQQAEVKPEALTYIEAHATGTPIGDALELKSIDRVVGKGRSPENPCYVGSVKTNIGHTETAAGIAGLIKIALTLFHRELPPHLHFQLPNPSLKFDKLKLQIPQSAISYKETNETLYMGVSTFGLSGSNVHQLLASAPNLVEKENDREEPNFPVHLFCLSAKTETALKKLASQYLQLCNRQPDLSLDTLCANVNGTRSQFSHRLTIIADSLTQLKIELENYLENKDSDRLAVNCLSSRPHKRSLLSILQKYIDITDIAQRKVIVANSNSLTTIWNTLAGHWREGTNFDWRSLYFSQKYPRLSLPVYPFEPRKFWSQPNSKDADVTTITPDSKHQASKLGSYLSRPITETKGKHLPPKTLLEKQIANIWEKALNIKSVNISDNFFELGGNSKLALQVFIKMEELLQRELPISILFQQPTIQGLINVFENQQSQEQYSSLVPIQIQGKKTPLFCLHAIGTSVHFYRNLCPFLPTDQPLYGLQSRFLEKIQEDPNLTLEKMAALYINEIKTIQPTGPYFLCGYSYGGLIAYEMAQQLKAAGEKIELLSIIDSVAPGGLYRLTRKEQFFEHLKNVRQQGLSYIIQKVSRQIRFRVGRLRQNLQTTSLEIKQDLSQSEYFEQRLIQVENIHRKVMRKYELKEYSGNAVLFIATMKTGNISERWKDDLGWGKYVRGRLETHNIPGCHFSVFSEPHVQILANKLQVHLENTQLLSKHMGR